MGHEKEPSLAKRLQAIGVKKSHAYMIARGDRTPSLPLALHIYDKLTVKLGPIAVATEAEIETIARVANRDAAA